MRVNTSKILFYMGSKLMTQSALAEAAGVCRMTVNTTLAKGSCSVVTAGKLAKALGVEPMDIIKEGE